MDARPQNPRPPFVLGFGFAALLCSFGGVLLLVGFTAIADRAYDLKWRAAHNVGIGPIGARVKAAQGVVHYRGAAAICLGVGFAAAGMMLATWAISMGLWTARVPGDARLFRMLGWLSLISLLVACSCFFPPWQATSLSFYGTIVVWVTLTVKWARTRRDRLAKVFPTFVIAVIVAGLFSVSVPVGMILGLFGLLFGTAHLAVLLPEVWKHIGSRVFGENHVP